MAASTVASTIWTLFCRVPQACFGAAFVFYGYVSESGGAVAREVRRRIAIYSAIPMAVAVVVFLALSPALIWILTAGNLDTWTGMIMVAAFFIVVVPYFFEGLNGELLSVLEDGGFMSWTSTLTTWLGNIGFAAFGIFVLHSAFWAFALAVIPTIVLGSAFTWRLTPDEPSNVGATGVAPEPVRAWGAVTRASRAVSLNEPVPSRRAIGGCCEVLT